MTSYQGSCHCARVQFTVTTSIDQVICCNCSICTKKGALHHRMAPEQFHLVSGEDVLSLYQFGTEKAQHYFCRVCGIHAFSKPRSAPDMISVNVRCLDDFDLESGAYQQLQFDGRNWEQAVAALNAKMRSLK